MVPLRILSKIVYCIALAFIAVSIYTVTIAQSINVEFADWSTMQDYYNLIFQYLPLAILLTLFGTIKMRRKKGTNLSIALGTIALSILSFFFIVSIMLQIGFGVWTDSRIMYKCKEHPEITIRRQRFDVGALGYGGIRIVKLKPFMSYWNVVTRIDTLRLNKNEWIEVSYEK